MAEKKAEQAEQTDEQPQTAAEAKQAELDENRTMNPKQLDTSKLPPVPGPGQFVAPEDSMEELSASAVEEQSKSSGKK